jgi:radical SAM protein with 4Fe4S-binding SPASM domain
MVVLNTVDPAGDEEPLANRHREICRTLGPRVMLGVNILSLHDDPIYVFDWVRKYDLLRTIRVGITHPIWGGTNDFFKLRGPRIISVLERLVAIGAEVGVAVGFDCGFTPCMFSQEFVDAHSDLFAPTFNGPGDPGACDGEYDASGARNEDPAGCADQTSKSPAIPVKAIGMRCRTVLDILPEGDCIACYALSRFRRFPLPSAGGYTDLVSSFDSELSPMLPAGIHRECLLCDYREKKLCDGGCRARRALRLRPNALTPLSLEPGDEITHK